jgi:hypothetical protein
MNDRAAESNGAVVIVEYDAMLVAERAPKEQVPAVKVDHV